MPESPLLTRKINFKLCGLGHTYSSPVTVTPRECKLIIYVYICMCILTYIYTYIHTHISLLKYTGKYIHKEVCICIYVYMCINIHIHAKVILGFPYGSAGKESACNVGDLGSIPVLGRSLGEGKGYPLQYSGLENFMDCIVHGVTKSWI